MERTVFITKMNEFLDMKKFEGKYEFIAERYSFDIGVPATCICILYDNVKSIRLNSGGDISISCKGFHILLWWCVAKIHVMALI